MPSAFYGSRRRQGNLRTHQWLAWLVEYDLGRKRLLDTLIAATWHVAGIQDIYTLNPKDFTIFHQFTAHPHKPKAS